MKFINFLRQAQFHGAIRLAEKCYRRWWALAMSILFGCSVTVVWVTVKRFIDNPTYMVQQEAVYTTMPFPSVLVCPEIMFAEYKIERFVEEIYFPVGLNVSYIKSILRQLAAFYSPDVMYTLKDLENIEHLLNYNGLDVDTAARKLMTTCEETLIRCRWSGAVVNCSSLFQMELTGDGYCCVFNGRSLSREILEYGMYSRVSEDKWFTNNFGFASGLMIVINQTQKLDNVDLSYKWLALQSNQHYVETTVNGTPLSPGFEQWAGYNTHGFQIANEVRILSDTLRQCRTADQPLTLFPMYNKKYCILECEIARTLERCHCVRAVHPKLPSVRQCPARSLLCAQHAMDTEECHCLQACDVDIDSVQNINFQLMPEARPHDTFYDGLNFTNVTIVRAFILNSNIKTKARWSYFTSIDLFSQLGGVFNVFFGVSILTVLELIQLAWKGFRYRRSNKKIMPSPSLKLASKPAVQPARSQRTRNIKNKLKKSASKPRRKCY